MRLINLLTVLLLGLQSQILLAAPTDIENRYVLNQEIPTMHQLPEDIRKALQNVFLLSDKTIKWTDWELKQMPKEMASRLRGQSRIRWANKKGDPSHKVLEISYYDSYSEGKRGKIYLNLNQPTPENSAEFSDPKNSERRILKRLTLNGVKMHFGEKEGDFREVYLERNMKETELQDRLRLAVLGNPILDPWLRRSSLALRAAFGDPEELPLSDPQKGALRKLITLYREGKLTEGALIQLITGMGKTEVMIAFLKYILKDAEDSDQQRPRMLWIVNEADLVSDTEERFKRYFGENFNSFSWDGQSIRLAGKQEAIARGEIEHLFVSFDSLRNPENKALLSQWISAAGKGPVLLNVDEVHTMGAETRLETFRWMWSTHMNRLIGRVGLSATPSHYIEGSMAQFFPHVYYGLLEPNEVDPVTGNPRIPYFQILQRAMMRGYISIALPYPGQMEDFGQNLDSEYTAEELRIIERMIRLFGPDMKALAFHSRGKNVKHGPAARAKQLADHLVSRGFASSAVSSDLPTRHDVMQAFKETVQGILNLVGIGTTGLDVPDVRMLLLLLRSESPNKIAQILGRALRKFGGKVIVPVLDPSGENLQILLEDYDSFFQISPEIETGVSDLLIMGDAQDWPDEIRKKLYRLLGIDPALIGVEGDSFDMILKTIRFLILEKRNFSINRERASELNLNLGLVQKGETLTAYLTRHRQAFLEAGLVRPWNEVQDLIRPLFTFRVESKSLDKPAEVNPRLLPFAWNRAFRQELHDYSEAQAKIWPHSPEIKSEVNRLTLIHMIVANHYLKSLRENTSGHVFFVARDSDDFYQTLLRLIDQLVVDPEENQQIKSRIHRLVLNHELLPTNSERLEDLSEIDEGQLLKILVAQGLTPKLIKENAVSIFDIGFHGTLLRPAMGALFSATKLGPEDFFAKVSVEVLASEHPDIAVAESTISNPLQAARDFSKRQSAAIDRHYLGFVDKYSKRPSRGRILEYFRGHGKLPLLEIDWVDQINDLIAKGSVSEEEVVKTLEQGDFKILSSHRDRIEYVRRYFMGEGVRADTKAAQDLAIGSRAVAKMNVSDDGQLFTKMRGNKPTHGRPINPRTAAVRVEALCRGMVARMGNEAAAEVR